MVDEPTNINWQNINYPKWKRNCRVLFAVFIGILITGVSLGIAILNKITNNNLSSESINPNIDCSKVTTTENLAKEEFIETELSSKYKAQTYCYCYNLNVFEKCYNCLKYIWLLFSVQDT